MASQYSDAEKEAHRVWGEHISANNVLAHRMDNCDTAEGLNPALLPTEELSAKASSLATESAETFKQMQEIADEMES